MTHALAQNLAAVRERIERACASAGRDPREVELLPVTKTVGTATARALCELGCADLAENRVDRLERQAAGVLELGGRPRWHLIGHLQRNKARRAVAAASVIHSVDSWRLLETLERVAAEEERSLDVYVELNLTPIAARTGLAPGELPALLDAARDLRRVRIVGLMTMAEADPRARAGELATQSSARATFRRLSGIGEQLSPEHRARFAGGSVRLSMGMSSDLEAAIHEGASVVRVGSALFEGLADVGGGA